MPFDIRLRVRKVESISIFILSAMPTALLASVYLWASGLASALASGLASALTSDLGAALASG